MTRDDAERKNNARKPGRYNRPLLFEHFKTWADLFEPNATTDKDRAPAPFKVQVEERPNITYYDGCCTIGPYMRVKWHHGKTDKGHTQYIDGPSAYVRLHPGRARQVFASTIGIADTMSFQCIVWDEHEALITCDHGKIIGGRWLAVIDPATIPPELRPRAEP